MPSPGTTRVEFGSRCSSANIYKLEVAEAPKQAIHIRDSLPPVWLTWLTYCNTSYANWMSSGMEGATQCDRGGCAVANSRSKKGTERHGRRGGRIMNATANNCGNQNHVSTYSEFLPDIKPRHKALGRHSFRRMDSTDYSWTSGGDENIKHVHLIGSGGYGQVHKVAVFVGS
jgi:hypothetical protein